MAHKVWIIIVSCFCLKSLYGVEMRGSWITGRIAEQGTGQPLEFADVDSLPPQERFIDRLADSRAFRMTYVGLPLVAGGLLIKSEDDHFRHLRNDYLPHFNRHADDYLQYLPAAVMLGMKLGGVEGRSSWGRMLASDAFSALLMGSVVYSLKQTTHVMRPDGSNDHSFPSGHTATAFMTATMLTKEYGHKSPWVGIGAYAIAATTGLMRMANNKHWLSDVLTGAGIGILSTELGYYLADLIFKEKGIRRFTDNEAFERWDKPSFFGLYIGMNIPLSGYDIDEQHEFSTSSGSTAGVEGAWFFSPYIGLGGRFAMSNTAIIVNGTEAEANTFDAISLSAGSYFSYPLSSRFSIGSKLLGGFVHYPKLQFHDITVPQRNGFSFGSGLSLTFRATEHYGMKLFLDYNLMPSHSRRHAEWMNTLVAGSSFLILF